MKVKLAVYCLLTTSLAWTQVTPVTGSSTISGVVVDERGSAIPSARVFVQRLTDFRQSPDGHRVVSQAGFDILLTADSNGRFSVNSLSAGRYHVCAYGTVATQVGSCEWLGNVAVFDLASGQRLSGLTRVVLDGSVVTFKVSDPMQRLNSGRRFHIGIGDNKYYQRATLVSKTSTELTFQASVPKKRDVHLFIDSDAGIIDNSGRSLEIGRWTGTTISTGTADALSITLTIL